MRKTASAPIAPSHKSTSNIEALARVLQGGAMPEDTEAFHKLLQAVQSDLKKLGKLGGSAKPSGRKAGRHVHNKLSDIDVRKNSKPGAYADGGGLYLHITPTGTKSWVFRYARKLGGEVAKAREMGLGALHTVSLAEAREKALQCRKLLDDGLDPIEHRGQQQAARVQAQIRTALDSQKSAMTFDKCVADYITSKSAEWSNDKHEQQWTNTLKTYASPVIGLRAVETIDTPAVVEVFKREDFWKEKTETAVRVRQRIEAVLDWAEHMGYRKGSNPARWNGCLEHLLPAPGKIKKVRPMPSLPYEQMDEFIAELRLQKGMAARALEFAILNVSRPGEVVGATWAEFDMAAKVWTIPAERMKGRKEHRVPLGDRAIEILREVEAEKVGAFVFPSGDKDKAMSDMAIGSLLKRMNKTRTDAKLKPWVDPKLDDAPVVAHGFRSTFSTWIAEKTEHPEDLREACLAHAMKNKVMAAYQRGDQFEKRRALMADWHRHCEGLAP